MTPTRASTQELAILRKGMYKIVFETKGYYELQNKECFYPWVEVCVLFLPLIGWY